MAQLKDTLVQGNLRITDDLYSDIIYLKKIYAPISSGGNTLSTGTSGYILKTGGSNGVYWAPNNADAFASNATVTLTGDVTGSASGTHGWSVATTIGDGKVTNAKLANSSFTLGGTTISLGDTKTTIMGPFNI
jgi:hypothetical protein